jgi:hypothetical protein
LEGDEMIGFDFLMSRRATDSEIIAALSGALHLIPEEIVLLEDVPLKEFGENVKVMCIKDEVSGDFPLKLSIDSISDDVIFSRAEVAQDIAEQLNVCLLLDDGSANPYKMILIKNGEVSRVVGLHADDADEGIYRLIDVMP